MITAMCILIIVLSAGSVICSWKAMRDAEIDLKESRKRDWKEEGARLSSRLDGILKGLNEINDGLEDKPGPSGREGWSRFRLYDDGELMDEDDIAEYFERVETHLRDYVEFEIPDKAIPQLAERYPVEYDVPF